MKKIFLLITILLTITIQAKAVSKNANVKFDTSPYVCSKFQDKTVNISGDTYFGRCMTATCDGKKWNLEYETNDTVTCSNGNLNPYYNVTKNGCSDYERNKCNEKKLVKYCTTITYFDCTRTTNGSKYVKTTKPITGTKPTQTVVTEPTKNNNIYLSSIKISTGALNFNKEVKEYNIEVGSNISYITINPTPEAPTSKAVVTGNTNLVEGMNIITITVTAESGNIGTYTIKVNKQATLSKNANLAGITINGQALENFNSTNYTYTFKTKESSLNVEPILADNEATYIVNGANNIKKGSIVKIIVTAPDKKTMQEYTIMISVPSSSVSVVTIIFIIILILVIAGGGFYFYTRQKNSADKEYEYE